ncbi:uncharacterized protein NPIL_246751 [Nephila pilipes]|uniref:Uncharacterized protein n=1 Tax=Nephila pilipes TaxID=299642 RepID=A0A8X6PCQ5_NEPPI|nr:uncharacterized protein NPIL_246751 [Nephila pilipes]
MNEYKQIPITQSEIDRWTGQFKPDNTRLFRQCRQAKTKEGRRDKAVSAKEISKVERMSGNMLISAVIILVFIQVSAASRQLYGGNDPTSSVFQDEYYDAFKTPSATSKYIGRYSDDSSDSLPASQLSGRYSDPYKPSSCSQEGPCNNPYPNAPYFTPVLNQVIKSLPRLPQLKSYSPTIPPVPVILFSSYFKNAVYSSKILAQLFDFNGVTANEFCRSTYPYILEALLDTHSRNPEYAAKQAARPIAQIHGYISTNIVVQVYANSVAKFLYSNDVLNEYNAVSLAQAYVEEMKKRSKLARKKGKPDWQHEGLKEGVMNFLSSLIVLTRDTVPEFAEQYGNEWRLVAS